MIEMDKKTRLVFFKLLQSVIKCEPVSSEETEKILCADFDSMYEFAVSQDLSHLIGEALGESGIKLGTDVQDLFHAKAFRALFRYETLNVVFENVCGALENAQVDFVPLKGALMRDYYSKPWLRTSCDIDILVKPEAVDYAADYLVENAGYTKRHKGSHNISLFSPEGVHVELHFCLVEKGLAKNAAEVLESVWEHLYVKDGFKHYNLMTDEMFYFYHIAHMAKHFENGGCGIRPFIDLWILNNQPCDESKRLKLLKKGNLEKFAENASKLSEVWFENKEADEVSVKLENYIFNGGLYGTDENRISVKQQQSGGKFKYAMSKIFIPYDVIKFHYPILEKHKWLTPVMEVRRWGKLIFCGHLKRTSKELSFNNNISDEQAANTKKFLNDIGL